MTKRALRVLFLGLACAAASAGAVENLSPEERRAEFQKLPWQKGPVDGAIGQKATLAVPADGLLLPEGKTARFFELTGNLPSASASVVVRRDWFAVFSFTDSGYIKDDEKLDPDALLQAIKNRDEPVNEQRVKHGLTKMHTIGWIVPPHYDAQTKHLEWGLRIKSDESDDPVINYTVRLLGRSGYESVVLVSSPERLDKNVGELKTMLAGFNFNSGEKYDEFKPGDKIAEYGLGALIVGGAAAAVVKTGFWKVILAALVASWKLVLAGAAAVVVGIRKFLSRDKTA